MYFTLQESQIFTSGNPVDRNGQKLRIRAKNAVTAVRKASRKRPTTVGRVWVVISAEPEKATR